jgi:regulator of cell morphogenesis and NO signaling
MSQFKSSQSVGEIVTILPKASDVFKKYQIDFCCGGNKALATVVAEQGLNEAQILAELEQVFTESANLPSDTDFTQLSRTDLINHIIDTHHRYLRNALPKLSELTTKILRVHGEHHPELFKVHKLFHMLKTELEQHTLKEELSLFPQIMAYEESMDQALFDKIHLEMLETEAEHDAAGDIIKELRQITNGFTAPADGCRTYYLTYEQLNELESDLFQHIHLENNILFKEFGK